MFSKIILSSVASFLIDIAIFTILAAYLKNIIPSYIVVSTYTARVISALCNYLINKNKVFKNESKHPTMLIKYVALCFAQVTLSAFLTYYLFNLTHINVTLTKVIVDTILFFFEF